MALQGSLLDLVEQPGLSELGDHVNRTQLSAGAWIEHVPGWISGAGAVFERLRAAVPWKAERRRMYDRMVDVPRLLCFYGEEAPLPDPVMEELAQESPLRTAGADVPVPVKSITVTVPVEELLEIVSSPLAAPAVVGLN